MPNPRETERFFIAIRPRIQQRTGATGAPAAPTVHNSLTGRSDVGCHPGTAISNAPSGLISSEDVQAALNELDAEKLARDGADGGMLADLDMNSFNIEMEGGDVEMASGSVHAANEVTMVLAPTGSIAEGRVHWTNAAGEKRLAVDVQHGSGTVTLLFGCVYLRVKNQTGLTIAAGKVVRALGADDTNRVLFVALAEAFSAGRDSPADALGFMVAALPDGQEGWVIAEGLFTNGPDLSSFGLGAAVWLNTAGTVSDNEIAEQPDESCSTHVKLGRVVDDSNPGVIQVKIERFQNLDDAWDVSLQNPDHTRYLKWVAPVESGCGNWQDFPLAFYPSASHAGPGSVIIGAGADDKVVLNVDATGGDLTLDLPAALSAINLNGRFYFIKKIDASPNKVILEPNGTDTIEGLSNYHLTFQNESVLIYIDGSSSTWRILSNKGIEHGRAMIRVSLGF